MISFFIPLILCFTVLASVGVGILAAYALVFAILSTFGHRPEPSQSPARPRLVLVPTQNHASGD